MRPESGDTRVLCWDAIRATGPRKVAFPAGRLQPLLMLGSAPGRRGDAGPSTNGGLSAVLVLYPVKAHNQRPPMTAKKYPSPWAMTSCEEEWTQYQCFLPFHRRPLLCIDHALASEPSIDLSPSRMDSAGFMTSAVRRLARGNTPNYPHPGR